MHKIKEVTVFTNGDSRKLSTWSNVPYFFVETLISKGIKVNRVDLSPSYYLRRIFQKIYHPLLRRYAKHTTYNYYRSLLHFADVKFRIKKAVQAYPQSDANIFLTFSFSSEGLTGKPNIQFGDWTYEHYIHHFLGRKPDFFEKQCIARENAQIERADLVFPLFPGVARYMKKKHKNTEIHYIGNVVNTLHEVDESEVLNIKKGSSSLLFIGSEKYRQGADALINAFERLKQFFPSLELHIIGMEKSSFTYLPESTYCYGYLNKEVEADRQLYYSLLKQAKVLVNTTPKWGAFSAAVEAMYFYTPVVLAPYDEFVETFGLEIDFGLYCEQNHPQFIEDKLKNVLSSTDYFSLCLRAHQAVKDFSWQAYIDKLLMKIESLSMQDGCSQDSVS